VEIDSWYRGRDCSCARSRKPFLGGDIGGGGEKKKNADMASGAGWKQTPLPKVFQKIKRENKRRRRRRRRWRGSKKQRHQRGDIDVA